MSARGNLKLIGIAGLVDGEEYTIKEGETVSIGRSRQCDVSLRNSKKYLAIDPLQQESEKHFQSVSRTHTVIEFTSPTEITIRDRSSNGTFLDGKRLAKECVVTNLPDKPHELKLGTVETFRLEFRNFVERKRIQVVRVEDGEEPPEGAIPLDNDSGDAPEPSDAPEEIASVPLPTGPSYHGEDPDATDVAPDAFDDDNDILEVAPLDETAVPEGAERDDADDNDNDDDGGLAEAPPAPGRRGKRSSTKGSRKLEPKRGKRADRDRKRPDRGKRGRRERESDDDDNRGRGHKKKRSHTGKLVPPKGTKGKKDTGGLKPPRGAKSKKGAGVLKPPKGAKTARGGTGKLQPPGGSKGKKKKRGGTGERPGLKKSSRLNRGKDSKRDKRR